MTHHRIGHLELRVRAAHQDPSLKGAAERFARAVLERCGDLLEARAPGRRYFVRRLPLRWSLGEAALADGAEIERLADALASDLVDSVPVPTGLVVGDGDVVAFEDDAHWRAAHLHACARGGGDAWYFARLGNANEARAELTSPERRALAADVLVRLARHGALLDVLAAAPADVVAAWMDLPGAAAAPSQGASGTPQLLGDLLDELIAARPRHLPASALRLGLRVHARTFLGGTATAAALEAAVAHVLARDGAGPATPVPPAPGPAGARATAGPEHTEHGALFFLLNPLLELRIGDSLFAACLPEGDLLLHALAALVGDAAARDPAASLCAGVDPGRPLPAIDAQQHEEIARALLAELAAALPRRGLATLPAVTLALHGAGETRLLVARVIGSPFALFAWPTPTPDAATAAIRIFLEHWPASAPPPVASPPLAELDRTGRMRPSRAPSIDAVLVPPASSACASALLAQLAGAPASLFVARAGEDPRAFAAPADVSYAASDTLLVSLPAEATSVALRRAGLDRDPGWVPWLGRHVRFHFTGVDELGALRQQQARP